jgi:hypothetical protein
MGYVIAGILVVLVVAGAIAFFVRGATTRTGQAEIAAPDEGTPVGTTDQHAEPDDAKRRPEAEKPASPGIGGPGEGGVGGEAEGSRAQAP